MWESRKGTLAVCSALEVCKQWGEGGRKRTPSSVDPVPDFPPRIANWGRC